MVAFNAVYQTSVSSLARGSLEKAASAEGVRWTRIVLASAAAYVHRLTGGRDVMLGLPVTARQDPQLKRIPGMVSNVLPLRLVVHAGMAQSELIHQVAAEVAGLLAHQRYRGEDLHRDLGLSGDLGTSFGLVVNIQSFDYDLKFAGNATAVHNVASAMLGDLSLLVLDRRDHSEIGVSWRAAGGVCSPNALNAHQERFVTLVEAMAVADPHQPIGRIDILSPDERRQLLVDYNDTAQDVPESTLPALFEAQVRRTPDNTAVVFEDTTLTYAELNARANRLARLLIERGIGPEQFVALAVPRSLEMIVAVLAVLKAGAAYVPIDADYPPARIKLMLDDAQPACLITTSATSLPDTGGVPVIVLDHDDTVEALSHHADADPQRHRPHRTAACPTPGLRDLHLGLDGNPQGGACRAPKRGRAGTRLALCAWPRAGGGPFAADVRRLHLRALGPVARRRPDRRSSGWTPHACIVMWACARGTDHRTFRHNCALQFASRGRSCGAKLLERGMVRRRGRFCSHRRSSDQDVSTSTGCPRLWSYGIHNLCLSMERASKQDRGHGSPHRPPDRQHPALRARRRPSTICPQASWASSTSPGRDWPGAT